MNSASLFDAVVLGFLLGGEEFLVLGGFENNCIVYGENYLNLFGLHSFMFTDHLILLIVLRPHQGKIRLVGRSGWA